MVKKQRFTQDNNKRINRHFLGRRQILNGSCSNLFERLLSNEVVLTINDIIAVA